MVLMRALRNRRERPAPCTLFAPRRRDEAHAGYALHGAHRIHPACDRPPTGAGFFHEGKAVEPDAAADRRRIAAEPAAVELEAEHAQPVAQAQQANEARIPRRLGISLGCEQLPDPPERGGVETRDDQAP